MSTRHPPSIFMIGDSTMADKSTADGNPERGWGQLLPEFFSPEVRIANHAHNGRSTKSFVDEGLWAPVADALQPGDWLIIQFGHNDQKQDQPLRYTDPATTYRDYLTRFVNVAAAKGAHPILATSICRRRFAADGTPEETLGAYPEAMRQLAAKLHMPLVDLNERTRQLHESLGPAGSRPLFLHFAPGELAMYPDGRADDTHLSVAGARVVASLFTGELRRLGLGLARWLRPDEPAFKTT